MSKEATQTISKYEAMLRLGSGGRLAESEIQRRVTNYGTASMMQRAVESQVRQILNCHGVPTISNPYYHACARELGKLVRQELPGSMMAVECRLLIDKWWGRGLVREVLRDIATAVFNIPLPEEEGSKV